MQERKGGFHGLLPTHRGSEKVFLPREAVRRRGSRADGVRGASREGSGVDFGRVLGSGSGGMRGRNGRACRLQILPRQNTLRGLRTGVRKPVTFTSLSVVI